MIVGLGLRRNRGNAVIEIATRRVDSNGGVRGVDIVLFVADCSGDPLKFPHVGQPNVAVAGLTSSDGGHGKGADVSENCKGFSATNMTISATRRTDYPVQETKRSDRLSGSTDCSVSLDFSIQREIGSTHKSPCKERHRWWQRYELQWQAT